MENLKPRFIATVALLAFSLPSVGVAGKSYRKGLSKAEDSAKETQAQVESENGESNINATNSDAIDSKSMKHAAESAGGQNNMGMMMNGLIGAGLIKTGVPKLSKPLPSTQIQGAVMIGLGLMALKQAMNQRGAAMGSYDVGGLVGDGFEYPEYDSDGNLIGKGSGTSGLGGGGNGSESGNAVVDSLVKNGGLSKTEATSLANQLSEASKQGFKIDPQTGEVTLPNGKTISPEQAMTPEGFAGAGGLGLGPTKKAYEDMENLADKVAGDLDGKMVATMEVDDSGGGGGGGAGMGFANGLGNNDDDSLSGFGSGKAGKAGAGSAKRKLAGMSKNYHGEPIGVASNNIFTMMTRRYKLKQKQNFFLREDEAR